MDNRTEEVKKILRREFVKEGELEIYESQVDYEERVSREICQLFPKTKDSPDGYKPKPDEKDKHQLMQEAYKTAKSLNEPSMPLTVDDCLKLYEDEGIFGLVEKVKEISFKAGLENGKNLILSNSNMADILHQAKQEGIKKAVERIEKRIFTGKFIPVGNSVYMQYSKPITRSEWQALKQREGVKGDG